MADDPGVRTSLEDGVLTVTIDRPEARNAVNIDVNRALLAAIETARGDGVAVVVLTGAGEKAFCSGGDLGGMRQEAGAVAQHRDRALFADVLAGLRRLARPVVGRINGDALAGGLGLALSCDLLVAADHARFGTPEVRVGMWPYMISTVLVDHLGPKRAMEMMLLGERIDAARALELGLVNRVVPGGELDEAVAGVVASLRALSPVVLGLGKESVARAVDMRRDEALAYLASSLSLHLQTDDAVEGISAFMAKRPPEWRGR